MYIHIETLYFFFHFMLLSYIQITYLIVPMVYIYDTWLVYIMLSEKPMEYKKNMNMCLFRLNKVYAYTRSISEKFRFYNKMKQLLWNIIY